MNPGMIGVFIPVLAIGGFFAWMLTMSPVGKAFADRLRHGPLPPAGAGSAEDHAELLETVEELRREVAELAERVDFTERSLGQQHGADRIGPPRA